MQSQSVSPRRSPHYFRREQNFPGKKPERLTLTSRSERTSPCVTGTDQWVADGAWREESGVVSVPFLPTMQKSKVIDREKTRHFYSCPPPPCARSSTGPSRVTCSVPVLVLPPSPRPTAPAPRETRRVPPKRRPQRRPHQDTSRLTCPRLKTKRES